MSSKYRWLFLSVHQFNQKSILNQKHDQDQSEDQKQVQIYDQDHSYVHSQDQGVGLVWETAGGAVFIMSLYNQAADDSLCVEFKEKVRKTFMQEISTDANSLKKQLERAWKSSKRAEEIRRRSRGEKRRYNWGERVEKWY